MIPGQRPRGEGLAGAQCAPLLGSPHPPPSGAPSSKGEGSVEGRADIHPRPSRGKTQAQSLDPKKGANFRDPGPCGPEGNTPTHTDFHAPDRTIQGKGVTPVTGVRGKGEYGRTAHILSRPPAAFCLLCRRGQSRSPPAGGEISPAKREINSGSLGAPPAVAVQNFNAFYIQKGVFL